MQFVVILAVGVILLVLILQLRKKTRDSEWHGTVIKIEDYTESTEDDFRTLKRITYRRDDGKVRPMDVELPDFKKRYADLAVGDRLDKSSGEMMPRASKP
jgi:hypothetical protein